MGDRIHSLDGIRFVAIIFVVMIHTGPFKGIAMWGNEIAFMIEAVARFAVPLFFLISGFFFARKTAKRGLSDQLGRFLGHSGALYVVALLINAPVVLLFYTGSAIVHGRDVFSAIGVQIVRFFSPVDFLYYGNSVSGPLWFLTALMIAVTLVSFFIVLRAEHLMLPLALSLHILGMFGQGYDVFYSVPFFTRDALFFGFFYVAVGYTFAQYSDIPARKYSSAYALLAAIGFILQVIEIYVLGYILGDASFASLADGVYTTNYTFATILVSISLFAFLLSCPSLFEGTRIERLGGYAVGIYIIHPAVLRLTRDIVFQSSEIYFGYDVSELIWYHLFLTPFVVVVSLGIFLLLDHFVVLSRVEHIILRFSEWGKRSNPVLRTRRG